MYLYKVTIAGGTSISGSRGGLAPKFGGGWPQNLTFSPLKFLLEPQM